MSRLGVSFAERELQRRRAGLALGRSILLWACICALACLTLRFLGVRL